MDACTHLIREEFGQSAGKQESEHILLVGGRTARTYLSGRRCTVISLSAVGEVNEVADGV